MIKNPPASAGDVGLFPGLGRFPGEGNATHSSILAWRIPWAEEPGRLQSTGSQESDNRIHDLRVNRMSGKNPRKERTTETVLINPFQIPEP